MLQRWALKEYVPLLPVHDAAMAYREGRSTVMHAEVHVANNYLLKLDFEDFFPSITGESLRQHLRRHLSLLDDDLHLLVKLFCWRGRPSGHLRLSIGAPSSPALSNTIMHEFDSKVQDYCLSVGVNYSRYADDMALSTNRPKALDQVYAFISRFARIFRILGLRSMLIKRFSRLKREIANLLAWYWQMTERSRLVEIKSVQFER